MRVIAYSMVVLLYSISAAAWASRTQPTPVEAVVYQGVKYTAPNDDGRAGYVEARDAETDKLIWKKEIYRNRILPLLEEDVQWVFIKTLSIVEGQLVISDERGRRYSLDLKTKKVKRLKDQE